MKIHISLLATLLSIQLHAQTTDHSNFQWPNGEKLAISLSYDDALHSQLDNAVPALNQYDFKASFYIIPTLSDAVNNRMEEWKALAEQGHELGNHSIYHPCSIAAGNDWVAPYKNIDDYSTERMKEELQLANTLLQALDGQTARTFTPPCGNLETADGNYIPEVIDMFFAIKGEGMADGFSTFWGPSEVTGKQLIDHIKQVEKEGRAKMVNILFHGIGGDHLTTSKEAHQELLAYLNDNKDKYWVDTFIDIMQYKKANL